MNTVTRTRIVNGDLRVEEIDVQLTHRETVVLVLVAKGLQTKQISAELSVPIDTVRGRVKSIYRKLEVQNRVQAAIAAYRLGIVEFDEVG